VPHPEAQPLAFPRSQERLQEDSALAHVHQPETSRAPLQFHRAPVDGGVEDERRGDIGRHANLGHRLAGMARDDDLPLP
jgi:hypothetical protein